MSITDELRRYISGPAKSGISHICEKAIANIADRIDAEHESACAEAYGNGVMSVALPDMTAYVKLPKDADGVTIRIGDELEWLDGNRLTVNGIGEGGTLFYVDVHGDAQWTASGDKRHVQPDSWERIIEDAQADGVRYHNEGKPSDFDALVERCKRLAGEDA